MRTLSHLTVKNWPETKGSQADKYSRLGLGKVWGFLYAHVTFEAVFRSLTPLAIWHICCLCFSFLNEFFFSGSTILAFLPGRKEQDGFRPCWEAWRRGCTNILQTIPRLGRGSWPRSQTTQGQRGREQMGRTGSWPAPPFKACPREWFSEKQISKHPTHSLGKRREIAKGREAWHVAAHGVTKRGTRLDRHALVSLAGERGCVGALAIKQGLTACPPCRCCNDPRGHKPCSMRCPGHARGARRLGQ